MLKIISVSRTIKALPVFFLGLTFHSASSAATPDCSYVDRNGAYEVSLADASVYKYIVERSVNGSPWYWRGAILDNDDNGYRFQDNGNRPTPDSAVRYRLRTKAENNASPLQTPVLCQLLDVERPSRPTSIQVAASSSNSLSISWQAATDNVAVERYIIYRAVSNGGDAVVVGDTVELSFADEGLEPSTSYWYYIRAVDASGNIGWRTGYHFNTTLDAPATSERYTTAMVNGRWEIVDAATSQVVHWNAVNVRSDKFIGKYAKPLGAEDIQALSVVFDTIRLAIHWDQLHTGVGQFNQPLLRELKNVLDYASQYNVDVILDTVHLGGSDNFWMPRWVWQQEGLAPSRAASFQLLKSDAIKNYLHWIMDESGLGKHPAVVAIEVVNEPHPLNSKGAWQYDRQKELMLVYKPMVAIIRQYRSDVLVVLGSYYGGHLFDNGIGDGNAIADVFGDTANLIWTAHNYFTGIEPLPSGPDYDGDGKADLDGQGYRGTRGAGVWTESYDSSGCYAQNPPYPTLVSLCNSSLPLRNIAQQGHANNAANHDRVAQQAGMPFFMGEFGMGRVRDNNTTGWSGTHAFMCDKLKAYSDLRLDGSNIGISWAVWAFDSQVDGGFGLYDSSTNKWVPDTSNAFFGRCE